ncbi:hypothetical protein SDC9_132506 [bioreactor metagenome]|uniref:Uncharacterized protein n=1 Tax=bioreactor metagenome TaxID=1076179 RepID=A0A645D887_9ZZZZ
MLGLLDAKKLAAGKTPVSEVYCITLRPHPQCLTLICRIGAPVKNVSIKIRNRSLTFPDKYRRIGSVGSAAQARF